jgi:hypothetical protein
MVARKNKIKKHNKSSRNEIFTLINFQKLNTRRQALMPRRVKYFLDIQNLSPSNPKNVMVMQTLHLLREQLSWPEKKMFQRM